MLHVVMHPVKHNHVKFGLIMSGVVVLCLLFMELTGQNQSFEKAPFFSVILFLSPLVVWYLGIKAKRKELKNKMTFQQGLSEGFKISFVYGAVSSVIFLLYYQLINPEILAYVRDTYGLSGVNNTIVIVTDMLVQFLSSIIFGTLYGAILSLFLKTK